MDFVSGPRLYCPKFWACWTKKAPFMWVKDDIMVRIARREFSSLCVGLLTVKIKSHFSRMLAFLVLPFTCWWNPGRVLFTLQWMKSRVYSACGDEAGRNLNSCSDAVSIWWDAGSTHKYAGELQLGLQILSFIVKFQHKMPNKCIIHIDQSFLLCVRFTLKTLLIFLR